MTQINYTEDDDDRPVDALGELYGWGGVLGWAAAVFLIFATLTSLLHSIFHYPLLPVFENSLAGFRAFSHWVLDTFLFSWLISLIQHACFWFESLTYNLLGIVPELPHITIPEWFKDAAILSAVTIRASNRADDLVGSPEAGAGFSDASMATIRSRVGFLGLLLFYAFVVVHRVLSVPVWWVAMLLGRAFQFVAGDRVAFFVASTVMVSLGGVTLGGLALLLSNTLEWILGDPIPSDRRWLRWTYLSIGLALAASAAFFVYNGYALGLIPAR